MLDIGFPLPQLHSLSISPSLICSTFACPLSYSALHHSVCNMFCKSVNIVPGVDLITSVGPTLFGCQYSNLSKHTLRHQADTHNRSPSPRSPTLHHSRCAPPPLPNSFFACSAPPAGDLPALVIVLSLSPKLKRPLWDLEIAGPPGEHLPYWAQISYTRFLFDFW